MFDRVPSSRLHNERRSTSVRGTPPNAFRLFTEPLFDLGRVRIDPLLPGLVRIEMVAGDVSRDQLLIRIRPAEPLEHRKRRRAALRELCAEDLVEDDVVVRALVLRDAST